MTFPYLFVSVFLPLMPAGMGGATPAPFRLARDGKPDATIVTAHEPSAAAMFAAVELQEHVEKITGARLPILDDRAAVESPRILVGSSTATKELGLPGEPFSPQEYLIRFLPETLVLMGSDASRPATGGEEGTPPPWDEEQGTSYAVHDFLERFCDVRWYGPTELERILPQTRTLLVPARDIRRAPAMRLRVGAPRRPWFMADILWNRASTAELNLFWARLRLGGEPYAASHAFYTYYDRFWERNPEDPDRFETAHPEWFAVGTAP